jgi:FkbM family methyltransferase
MGIRKFAARTLSSRQKSIVRRCRHLLGIYPLGKAEKFVDSIISLDGARTFLQVGANDGYYADPLNLAIFCHGIRGTFVEPQRYYFDQLQNTYAGFSGLTFLQCAIAENGGKMRMFSLDCSSGKLPYWARGVGTLSREQLLRLEGQIPNVEKYIVSSDVSCVTVRELFEETSIKDPDIVVVDAEGYDYHILAQFDFSRLGTKLVIFEADSMPAHQQDSLSALFDQAGFAVVPSGQDTVAIRCTTATWKGHKHLTIANNSTEQL